jgi:hypothetical protein
MQTTPVYSTKNCPRLPVVVLGFSFFAAAMTLRQKVLLDKLEGAVGVALTLWTICEMWLSKLHSASGSGGGAA